MLHTFTAEPDSGAGVAEGPSGASASALPPHGLNIAKVTATYTALLQVPFCSSCYSSAPLLSMHRLFVLDFSILSVLNFSILSVLSHRLVLNFSILSVLNFSILSVLSHSRCHTRAHA